MVSRGEIIERARLFNLKPYQAEKEYFQHLLLFLIYSSTSSLVFKGGTALKKAYGLDRFSEDLDFTQLEKIDYDEFFSKISKILKERFGFENEVKRMKSIAGSTYRFKIMGPLISSPKGLEACYIYLDISGRAIPKTRDTVRITPLYSDVPEYTLIIMSREEIAAEKVRALMKRAKARDAYDLWHLLKSGVEIRIDWVNEKLEYYKMSFSKQEFFEALEKFRKNWQADLKPLVGQVPEFEEVVSLIKSKFNELKGY